MPYVQSGVSLLSVAVVLIGWFIVNRQHDRRDRRKEVREQIADLKRRIGTIQDKALEYYSLDGKDPKAGQLAFQIRLEMRALPLILGVLRKAGMTCSLDNRLIAFRQTVTGGAFDTVNRKKCDFSSEQMSELAAAAGDLIVGVEDGYFEQFKVKLG